MRKFYLSSFFVIILFFIGVIYWINSALEAKNNKLVYANIWEILTYYIQEEEKLSLSIAISLGKNDTLKEALIREDERQGFAILKENISSLTQFIKAKHLRAQVLTEDLFVVARSWDPLFGGMPLEDFREDLQEVISTKKPKVEIETGKFLSIKATSPIKNGDDVVGMLEVLVVLDAIVDKMRQADIELIPIMANRYLQSAYLMELNPSIQNQYTVVNKNYNNGILRLLNGLSKEDFAKLCTNDFIVKDGNYFAAYPMKNSKNKELGKFVVVMKATETKSFVKSKASFIYNILSLRSSETDFYDFEQHQNGNMFLNIKDAYIGNLQDVVDPKDAKELEEVTRRKLSRLTKEELVEFILSKSKQQEIKGQIR